MKKIMILTVIITIISISGCSSVIDCPDAELYDFDEKVENRAQAITFFKEYFAEEKGFPPFNESQVYEFADSKDRYIYMNQFGLGGTGGVLREDGKLVQKGYCK
ncbi:MAG: hypothetical protein NDI94_05900 [Candidatus Woesearchaeota archaeon]|nr:hypothetical protein [Candidatus Woesearchaeota archaeon]